MKKAFLLLVGLLISVNAHATTCTLPYGNALTGGFIFASQWNANVAAIQACFNNQILDGTTNIAVGGIQTANLANLSVTDSKIFGITTAGKVNGSAITGANNLPSGSGVWPTVNLGSGTANTGSFLRGDQSWSTATTLLYNYGSSTTTSSTPNALVKIAFGAMQVSSSTTTVTNLPFTSSSSYTVLISSGQISNIACSVLIASGSQFTASTTAGSPQTFNWVAIGT